MGVTVSYRGSLEDMERVEEFEDRVLDLALEVGGRARIWRSVKDDDPRRMVRGATLELYPGQETTSLLISPEGWLIKVFEIEEAENGQLTEPPWCFVKTQYGPLEGHMALVELLAALKREFFPNLEVEDEGGYWETRDLELLKRKLGTVQAAIDGLAEGLQRYGLTSEAAEDPEILIARITRVAEMVQRTLGRPDEHPPVLWEDDDGGFAERSRHPLLERVMQLYIRLHDLAPSSEDGRKSSNYGNLLGAAGEMMGGLSQALGSRDFEPLSGLSVVQLKRALRGAAFAFGALFPLRADGLLDSDEFDELAGTVQSLQDDIYSELARLREARGSE